MNTFVNFIKKQWTILLGIILGMIFGFLYWYFIGCNSGSCPITSSPGMSVLWGGLTGGLLSGLFKHK